MFDLTGRTALVTGSGRGVGAGIAKAMIEAGARVLVNDVVAERAAETAASLGPSAAPLPFDVTDFEAVERAVAAAGPIDILVHNAGIPASMRAVKFRSLPREEWGPYIDVNLYGLLNCAKAVIEGMCERGWGRVITISSGSGTHGQNLGVALYGAGKGGGISFTRHLAMECAADGVTANTLALGMMARPDESGGEAGRTVTKDRAATIPVGRPGTGEDIGYTCVFLASNEAAWITGQTISVNGGSITT